MRSPGSISAYVWGLLVAAGVGLAAAWWSLAPGLPYGHDSLLHLCRLVAWDEMLRGGILFPRWVPFLGYGYGSAVFNYYPPLAYVLAEPFLLVGIDPASTIRLVLGLALVAGAAGVYRWVGELLGPGPGVVATTSFVFSPYVVSVLTGRVSPSEMIALAGMGWTLWAYRRYARGGRVTYGVASAAGVAVLMLAHPFSAYVFLAGLVAYGIALFVWGQGSPPAVGRGLAMVWPLGLGLGLAAFYWLPAVVEADLVQIERLLLVADPVAGEGLMPPWAVFSGPLLPDRSLPVAVVEPRLGGLATGLALVGVVGARSARRWPGLRLHVAVGLLVVVGAVFLHTPASRWLWGAIPLLRLTLFPARFLGVASLWLALLAAAGVAALLSLLPAGVPEPARSRRERKSRVHTCPLWTKLAGWGLVAGLVVALSLYAWAGPPVAVHGVDLPTDLVSVIRFERTSGAIDLINAGEYQPRWVTVRPPAESGPAMGEARLAVESLPDGVRVVDPRYGGLEYVVTTESPEPFRAVFNTFYFPGWRAWVNGQAVSVTPGGPHGLISLDVPAGQQRIEVRFGPTPVRAVAVGLSWSSGAILVGLLIWVVRGPRRGARTRGEATG